MSEPKAKSSNEGHWCQGATRKFRKQGLMKNSTLKIVGHFFPKIQDKRSGHGPFYHRPC